MRRYFIYAGITLLFLSFFIGAGFIIQNLSIEELEFLLREKRINLSQHGSLSISTNMELLRLQLNSTDTDRRYYETEAYSRSIADWINSEPQKQQSPLLRFTRSLFNQPQKNHFNDFFEKLEYAYWLERHKQYLNAEAEYANILIEYDTPKRDSYVIELHRAFCLTASRRLKSAGDLLNTLLITDVPDDIYMTAKDMQDFIADLESRPQNTSNDKFDQAMDSYRNLRYKKAEEALTSLLTSEVNNNAARYYLGRTLEEQGNIEDAGIEYKRILLSSKDKWKQLAARRLAMLELFYESGISSPAIEILREEEPEFLNQTIVDLAAIKKPAQLSKLSENSSIEIYIDTNPTKTSVSVNNQFAGQAPLFFTAEKNQILQITASTSDVTKSVEIKTGDKDDKILITLKSGLLIKTQLIPKIITLGSVQLNSSLSYRDLEPGNYILTFFGEDSKGNSFLFERAIQLSAGEIYQLDL